MTDSDARNDQPAQDSLAALINEPAILTLADGSVFPVTPIRVKELPAFLRALHPVINILTDSSDLPGLFISHSEEIIAATAIGLRLSRAQVDEFGVDDLLAAATLVVEVNMDFFVKRVQPAFQRALSSAAGRLTGSTMSSDLLAPGTSPPTS